MKKTILLLLIIVVRMHAQNDAAEIQKLLTKDSTLSVLFSYPDSVRSIILTASTYPQGFVKLEEIQKKTSESFKSIISRYSQSRQKQLWELTRYPELIPELIKNKDKSKRELKELLKSYPKKIVSAAVYFTHKDYELLVAIDQIHKEFNRAYEDMVKDFPPPVQYSFHQLLQKPELIKLLSDNIKTTMMVGDIYKRSPDIVKQKTDAFHDSLMRGDNSAYQEWKNGIIQDSDMQKELKEIADKYERAKEYQDDIYTDKDYSTTTLPPIFPYPYWAGYPYWVARPYWYPYPWWYNSGFYFYPNGNLFYIGIPTYHFRTWYYGHPHYSHQYPKTSDYFQHHFEGRRGPHPGFSPRVNGSEIIIRRRK